MRFLDRQDAGQQLARVLSRYRGEGPLIVAIPRGGVSVGYQVAHALHAPLEVFIARKIGCPGQPEYGVGALGEGGVFYLDHRALETLGLSQAALVPEIHKEARKIQERLLLFRRGRPLPPLESHTVVLVDDGIATGGTIKVALKALRLLHPARLILAVPVAAEEALEELRPLADEVLCLLTLPDLGAVGFWYQNFQQVSDEEVLALLSQAQREQNAPGFY